MLLTAQATYSLRTGQMTDNRVTHTASSADTLHHLEYTAFDAFGNLTQQQNTLTGLTESFHYDKLHRLTGNTVTYGGQTVQQIDYAWDAVGNLLKKTDYSADRPDAYIYHTRQPNAVATVLKPDNSTVSFSYDARGNLTTGDGLTATYNSWDKPTRLTRSKQGISTTMAFTYGADLMRYKQVSTTDGISSTTYYIDKLYEETHTAGRTEWKAYISEVAVVGETQQQGRYIAFTHKDRLGSGTTFADHEHLDEIDIIHMNGRIYDYNLSRFMSVDQVIQSPGNSQSMNPYSYIMNNPLAGTDPTGYSSECESNCGSAESESGENCTTNCDISELEISKVIKIADGSMVVETPGGDIWAVETVNGKDIKPASDKGITSNPDINTEGDKNRNRDDSSSGDSVGFIEGVGQRFSNLVTRGQFATDAQASAYDTAAKYAFDVLQ